jgi:acetyl-CoA synthetase
VNSGQVYVVLGDSYSGSQTAESVATLIWEGEDGTLRRFTYAELHGEVARFASGLSRLGVKRGDVVTIYMGMVPELTITMLACARIGAAHNVVFAGFSAEALAARIKDAKSTVLITADGAVRRGKTIELGKIARAALSHCPEVKDVLILDRLGIGFAPLPGITTRSWHEIRELSAGTLHPAIPLPSEQPLFMLYTSGSTGKPKGILHTTAGYLLGATLTCQYVFDLNEHDIFWCTADQGWITGHTYGLYGPLSLGATVLMYEGSLDHPDSERVWRMITSHQVTIFYTAPTALRAFIKHGADLPAAHDLSSLRLLGSVGEMINPRVWRWFHSIVGKERCPLVDTWWQTETGAAMVSTVPGALASKPGCAGHPLFGIDLKVVDENGEEVPVGNEGFLVVCAPWPYMMRTIVGDHPRFIDTYWTKVAGAYFTGDFARKDLDGYVWILGRCDDVINVSAHRISTMEVESLLVAHPVVAEAAAVGVSDEITGQQLQCFVSLHPGVRADGGTRGELISYIATQIGTFARPREIVFMDALPKTRSGKIMRRILRDKAEGREVSGDISTLES